MQASEGWGGSQAPQDSIIIPDIFVLPDTGTLDLFVAEAKIKFRFKQEQLQRLDGPTTITYSDTVDWATFEKRARL